jgi:cytochrome b561
MARERTAGFSGLQIGLHWLIAALVVTQILTGGAMEEAFDALRDGEDASTPGSGWHLWSGIAVLVLTLLRLAVRIRQGAPPEPAGMARPLAIAARASHHLFYLLLVVFPISGLVAYYVNPAAAGFHSLARPVFIVLIAIHAGAALWHQFVRRDGLLMRMFRPAA